MAEGFYFDELSDFKKDLLNEANKLFPKETEKFLKTECQGLLKVVKRVAKANVGTAKGTKKDWQTQKSYHKRFKVGKKYFYNGDLSQRVYNGSPHGHLIEYGHKTQNGKFVSGKYVFEKASTEYGQEFSKNCDEFLGQYFDDIGDHK